MEEEYDSQVYSKNVIEFVAVANEYCSFLENVENSDRPKFVGSLQKLLPLLYLKAALLPTFDESDIESPEKFVGEVDYHHFLLKLQVKMGQFDSYLEVFDPNLQFSEAPLDASISENLCDIYQDVKDFVMAYQIGSSELMAGALWECRNNFVEYWGQKLVNCLRAIHQLVYGSADLKEENIDFNLGRREEQENPEPKKNNWLSGYYESCQDE